ncbi:MAG: hypothetical protein Q7S37_00180 [bacterium]|nr:hypothetical protein [bacterium]
MSKKWKSKLKKQQRAKIIRESLAEKSVNEPNMPAVAPEPEITSKTEVISSTSKKQINTSQEKFLHKTTEVRAEIRKIGIVFGIIILLLVAAKILDYQTNWVTEVADIISGLIK